MSRYSTYGDRRSSRDDLISTDYDSGFYGFNNRIRPDQLPPGMLAESNNMRIDLNGEPQVRKGIELVSSPVAITATSLSLPFHLEPDDTSFSIAISSGDLVATGVDVTNQPSAFQVLIEGVTGITPDPNGVRTATKDSNSQFTIPDQSYSGSPNTSSATVKYSILNDSVIERCYGSTNFSDPSNANSSYIILATNKEACAIDILTGVKTSVDYPSGVTISQDVSMLQAFDKVFIFRDGKTALEWDGDLSGSPAFEKVSSGAFTQPQQISTYTNYKVSNNTGIVSGSYNVSKGKVIEVISSGETNTSGLAIGSEFVVQKVFTAESTKTVSAAAKSFISGGEYDTLWEITLTATGHGYSEISPITIAGFSDANIDGERVISSIPDADTIIIHTPIEPTLTISGDETVALNDGFGFYIQSQKLDSHITEGESIKADPIFSQKISSSLGYEHMPAPPWGVYHQRRLIVPAWYTPSATEDVFDDNGTRDELSASDILDTNTYDRIFAKFRFNAGTSDYLVGAQSFARDSLLVFNRNSIFIVVGINNIETAQQEIVPGDIGCVARRTITRIGNQVFFLSDNGVYSTEFADEYNLRGVTVPISEPINETIKRINKDAWENSVSVYFNNRYYIAVPIDGSVKNNAILIYNFLNKQWESIDTVDSEDFDIQNMLVAGNGGNRGVFLVNEAGSIHQIEKRVDGNDRMILSIGGSSTAYKVDPKVVTRMYTGSTIERKKWNRYELHLESSSDRSSDMNISIISENIDSEKLLTTLENLNGTALAQGEDISARGRIGNRRSYGIQFVLDNMSGRPKIRSLAVDGIITYRATQNAK